MKLRVKYTAQLKKAVGKGEELVEVQEGLTIQQLLENLYQIHKEAFAHIVFNENGEYMDAILLIRNGKQMAYTATELLENNDTITLMAPIAGG